MKTKQWTIYFQNLVAEDKNVVRKMETHRDFLLRSSIICGPVKPSLSVESHINICFMMFEGCAQEPESSSLATVTHMQLGTCSPERQHC